MANESRLNKALQYAKLGLKIHPLHWITDCGYCSCGKDHGGDTRKFAKHPRLNAWPDKASADIGTVTQWWTKWPKANIGLSTGKVNGLVVLDLDKYKDMYEAPKDIPDTVWVTTGSGGQQHYYRYPEGHKVGSRSNVTGTVKIDKGVDVKADGGLVVAVGSVTHGGPYNWSSRIRPTNNKFHEILTPCPSWIIDLFNGRAKTVDAVKSRHAESVSDIKKGHECLKRLNKDRADDYDSWLHVGMALHTVGVPLDDWIDWSKDSDKFDENVCKEKWKSFDTERDTKYGLNALIEWAAQDSNINKTELLSIIDPRPWPDLIRLEDATVPEFPIESLPPVLRNYVQEVAENKEVSVDMPAMMGLATVAAASAKRFVVCPRPGWKEPSNAFVLTVSPPGTRKSAVHESMCRPLQDYETKIIEGARGNVMKYQSLCRALENKQKRLEKKGGSQSELDEVNALLADKKDVHLPTVMTSDATPEQMAVLMKNNHGRLALFSAEGTVFNVMSGLYTKGQPHYDVYLQGHSGDRIAVDRVGRERVVVNHPALTVCICVQPDIFSSLHHKQAMVGSGLLARFLYTMPSRRSGAKQNVPVISETSYKEYEAALLKLLHTQSETPYELTMDAKSTDLFFNFRTELDSRFTDGDLSGVAEWASKLAGQTARIAGLLHLARNTGRPEYGRVIKADTVQNAIGIGRYLIGHAKKAFACLDMDQSARVAERVVAWIKRHQKQEFTKRELYQGLKGKTGTVTTIKDLKEPLEVLRDHGYMRPKVPGHSGKRGGPTSESYEVHPDFIPQNEGFGGFGG